MSVERYHELFEKPAGIFAIGSVAVTRRIKEIVTMMEPPIIPPLNAVTDLHASNDDRKAPRLARR